MSWFGLLSFLFLTLVVAWTLLRSGVRRSDLSSSAVAGAFKKSPTSTLISLTFAIVVFGYVFARKVFPQIFPDWVKSVELGLGAVLLIAIAALIFIARRDGQGLQEKILNRERLRPKFDDESHRTVQIQKDETTP